MNRVARVNRVRSATGLVLLALALSLTEAVPRSQVAYQFNAVAIAPLSPGLGVEPLMMNGRGVVVGRANVAGGVRGFVWTESAGTAALGVLPGGSNASAEGVNYSGAIVGWSETSDGAEHAVIFAATGEPLDLHHLVGLGGTDSHATAISNTGRIVGWSTRADGTVRGFVLHVFSGAMTVLPGIGGPNSRAYDIDESGRVAGAAETSAGRSVAVTWQCTVLCVPSIHSALPSGLRRIQSGAAAGALELPPQASCCDQDRTTFSPTAMNGLLVSGGTPATTVGALDGFAEVDLRSAIPDGWAVGLSARNVWHGSEPESTAVLVNETGMQDLNAITGGLDTPLRVATDINPLRWIIALGLRDGVAAGYLLKPTNTPPVAEGADATIAEDTTLTGVLNVSDADNDPLTFAIVTAPAHGTVTITNTATGAFTYRPNPNYHGPDAFTFRAIAADGMPSNTAMIAISVTPVRDIPVVTVGGGTFPYDGQPHMATGSVTGVFGEPLLLVTFTYNGQVAAPVAIGTYTVVARFPGNAEYLPAEGTGTITITRAVTSVALTTTPNPSSALQLITLTANVAAASGLDILAGEVHFFNGTTLIASAPVRSGTAYVAWPGLPGAHQLSAAYSGDPTFAPATSSVVIQSVASLSTSTATAVAVSPTPSASGAPVTLYAIVSPMAGTGAPSGTVDFYAGATLLGSRVVTTVGTYRVATLTVPLGGGTHAIRATYAGDAAFRGSTSAWTFHTAYTGPAPAPTTTTISTTPNPSAVGQPVSLTMTVRSPGRIPHGTVFLLVNGAVVAGLPLASVAGTASVTVPIGGLPRGLYALAAVHLGGEQFAASSSANLYVCVDCASSPVSLAVR